MSRLRWAGTPALAVSLLATPLAVPAAAAPGGPDPDRPWVVRTTTVDVDASNFAPLCRPEEDGLPDELDLATYPYDVLVHAVADFSERQGDSVDWTGHVEGEPGHQVHFHVTNACGGGPVHLTGAADLGRYRYVAYPADEAGGRAVFEEIDTSLLPPRRPSDTVTPPLPPGSGPADRAAARKPATPQDPAQIDVLFGFTPKAAAMARKEYAGKTDPLDEAARNAERRMNRSLAASGVPARIDAVHVAEFTGYKGYKPFRSKYDSSTLYTDSEDHGAVLELMQAGTEPTLGAPAQRLRKAYGADLVSAIVGVDNVGGVAGSGLPEQMLQYDTTDWAYSASQYGGIRDETVSHELGHLFGLSHDRKTLQENGDSPSRTYPYNTGYVAKGNAWHSIMAYDSACGGCEQMPRYSHLKDTYKGRATGDKDNHSADALKLTAHTVAGYQKKLTTPTRHALKMAASPAKAGSLTPTLWGPYRPGTEVNVSVRSNPGYAFSRWTLDKKDQKSRSKTLPVAMTGNHTLTATFRTCAKTPHRGFRKLWMKLGHGGGRLGCATTDARKTVKGGWYMRFDHGVMYWSPKSGTHAVWGAFLRTYQGLKYERGRLGYPTSDETRVPGGVRQTYQGGTLTWNAKSRKVTVRYS